MEKKMESFIVRCGVSGEYGNILYRGYIFPYSLQRTNK